MAFLNITSQKWVNWNCKKQAILQLYSPLYPHKPNSL